MKVLRTFATANLLSAGLLLIPATLALPALAQTSPAPAQTTTTTTQTETQPQTQTEPAQTMPPQTQAEPQTPMNTEQQNGATQQPYQGQDHDNIQTSTSAGQEPTKTQYTREQLITSTVHQAWLLSGRNEANFVEMVEQIADISAHNRGVKLPDSAEAGRKMGEYIKQRARQDTDELLYAIVDKAVLNATTDATPHAGARTEHNGAKAEGTQTTHEGVSPQ